RRQLMIRTLSLRATLALSVIASVPALVGPAAAQAQNQHMEVIHHPDYDKTVFMPFVPAIKIKSGKLLWLAGTTALPVYHDHPPTNSTPLSISVAMKARLRLRRSSLAITSLALCFLQAAIALLSSSRSACLPLSTSVNSATSSALPLMKSRTAVFCASSPKPLRPWRAVETR